MQTTGIFKTHRHEVVAQEGKPWLLIPFGDVHRSAPLCHVEKWYDFLEWCKLKLTEYKGRVLFLGMGDYDDLASASERRILGSGDLHESTAKTLDQLYKDNVNRLSKELSFMRGHLIGCIEGNHYATLTSGITSTQLMCEKLQCPYLGVSAFVRLTFKRAAQQHSRYSVDIWAHHGKGASRLVGGSLNRVQQMAEAAEADIYLMGHDHRKSVGMTSKLYLSDGGGEMRLSYRKHIYGRTGSFLKGYEPGEASYIADAAMSPTDLGNISITMVPKRNKDRGRSFVVDLQASL